MNTIKAYWFVFSLLVRTALPKIPDKKKVEGIASTLAISAVISSGVFLVVAFLSAAFGPMALLLPALIIVFSSMVILLIAIITLVSNDIRENKENK